MIVFGESSKLTFSGCMHVPVVSISLYVYILSSVCAYAVYIHRFMYMSVMYVFFLHQFLNICRFMVMELTS